MSFSHRTSESKALARGLILNAIIKAANNGDQAPNNEVLGKLAKRAPESVRDHIRGLVREGLIETRRRSNYRAFRIVATGKFTAGFDYVPGQDTRSNVVALPPVVRRDPCPFCGARMDADPSLCCARGREYRKLVA